MLDARSGATLGDPTLGTRIGAGTPSRVGIGMHPDVRTAQTGKTVIRNVFVAGYYSR